MKKCALIIETSTGKLIIAVPNFSKENVLAGLKKVLCVDVEKIVQISASASYGIYGIKEVEQTALELFTQTVRFMSNEYPLYFVVDYGYIVE
jgi:hypothetical protein